MKKFLIPIYLFFAVVQAWAVDTFNPANGQLTIPQVIVGNVTYSNIVITVGKVISIGILPSTSTYDTFDVATGQLSIASVIVEEKIYYAVVITVGNVISIGGQSTTDALFASAPQLLPDIGLYVGNICSETLKPWLNSVTTVDLNADGRTDLLVSLMCNVPGGTILVGPTPNRLVALTQLQDGSFKVDNLAAFGKEEMSLGGFGSFPVIGDFNRDGRPDFAYSVNREDGRLQNANLANQTWYPTILMSQPNGTYSLQEFGVQDYMSAVAIVENDVGGVDALFDGFNLNLMQVYRYVSGVFNRIMGYPSNTQVASILAYPRVQRDKGSEKIVTTGGSVETYLKANNVWSFASRYSIPSVNSNVQIFSHTGNLVNTALSEFDGMKVTSYSFDFSCLLKITPQSEPIVIAGFSGGLVPSAYIGGILDEGSLTTFNTLFAFDTNNGSVNRLANIFSDKYFELGHIAHLDCKDINGDGYDDLVVSKSANDGGRPMIYLNSKNGKLMRYDTASFPALPISEGESASVISDLDGDGISELILFPRSVDYSNNSLSIRVYKGLKKLK